MKIVDARSGAMLSVGSTVNYPDGEWTHVVAVRPGLFRASADLIVCERNPMTNRLDTRRITTPLAVRWTHPRFFLQHVGFIPS